MKTFNEECYNILRSVPKGKVTTYSAIAHALGCKAYRAVGNAMNKNPYQREEVACHRVVNSDGRLGGYANALETKVKRLESEGIEIEKKGEKIENWKIKNFDKVKIEFEFDKKKT